MSNHTRRIITGFLHNHALPVLYSFGRDLRFAIRHLGKVPLITIITLLSLALGIGANTALFSLVDAIILRPLPVRDPHRLVLFYDGIMTGTYSGHDLQSEVFSYPFWQELQSDRRPFEAITAFRRGTDRVTFRLATSTANTPEQATVQLIAGNYFAVLGVGPALGRVLTPADDLATAPRVAVLSYRFWRARFRLDPTIVGREVVLNDLTVHVVGVADREFFGERIQSAPDVWLPLSAQPDVLRRENWFDRSDVYWLNMIGRLQAGATLEGAQSTIVARLHQHYLAHMGSRLSHASLKRDVRVQLKPGGAGISGVRYLYSKPLYILLVSVNLLLVMACANIAALLLARSVVRRREFLTRLALGATRARVLRQVLTENVLLSVLGGLAGLGVAWLSVTLLVSVLNVNTTVVRPRLDLRVLSFTLIASVLSGILIAIVPALTLSGPDLRTHHPHATRVAGRWRVNGAQLLITCQVAFCCVLLFGAGLFTRSLFSLERQQVGFTKEDVTLVRTDLGLAGYRKDSFPRVYRELTERLSAGPGLHAVGICRFSPVSGSDSSSNFSIQGHIEQAGRQRVVHSLPVSPGFFETLDIPVRHGRTFSDRDSLNSPSVAVVNQAFVRQYMSGESAVGKHISLGSPFKAPGSEIIGVVGDSRYYDVRQEAPPMVFFSLSQAPVAGVEILLKTTPSFTPEQARLLVKEFDSKLPILNLKTLAKQIDDTLVQQRLVTILCSLFATTALFLALIGIYGTLAFGLARRSREIGIRMAIGARRLDILWMVVREVILTIGCGLLIGLPLGIALSQWLRSFLFGIPAIDVPVIVTVVSLIIVAAVVGGGVPARRACSINPARSLRFE